MDRIEHPCSQATGKAGRFFQRVTVLVDMAGSMCVRLQAVSGSRGGMPAAAELAGTEFFYLDDRRFPS